MSSGPPNMPAILRRNADNCASWMEPGFAAAPAHQFAGHTSLAAPETARPANSRCSGTELCLRLSGEGASLPSDTSQNHPSRGGITSHHSVQKPQQISDARRRGCEVKTATDCAPHIRASSSVARPTHHRTHHHHHPAEVGEIGPAGDGETHSGRALTSRGGAPRDSRIQERAAMILVLGFFGAIGLAFLACKFFVALLVGWSGVAEAASRSVNLN